MDKIPERQPEFERWQQGRATPKPEWEMPDWQTTITRGILGRCPHCNAAPIFNGYLNVHPVCLHCRAPFGNMPADDAPPYIAMVVVLQIVGAFVVLFYKGYYKPGFFMSGFMLVLLAITCMVALRMAKGAVIGILLKLGLKREVI